MVILNALTVRLDEAAQREAVQYAPDASPDEIMGLVCEDGEDGETLGALVYRAGFYHLATLASWRVISNRLSDIIGEDNIN